MSQIPCPVDGCDRTRPGHAQVCGACSEELRRALAAVPDLAADLDVTLSRQTSTGGAGARGIEVPLPYDPRATEAAGVLRSALVGWVRVLQDDHAETWPADTLTDMSRWLLERHQRLVGHAVADEAVDEIRAAVRAAQRVVDRAPGSQFAGPCPGCGAALYTPEGWMIARCRNPECDVSDVDIAEQQATMRATIEDRHAHPTAAAALLARLGARTPEPTIRRWAKQGLITPVGTDDRGRSLYRIGDILTIRLRDGAVAATL